jgi:hypothetical protein
VSYTGDPAYDYDEWCSMHVYDDPDDGDCVLEEPPDFGCACENAVIVDTTCQTCIENMQEEHEELYWADQNVATVPDPAPAYTWPEPKEGELPF